MVRDEYKFIDQNFEPILKELAGALNTLLERNHSLIFWRVLIGPWLNTFMAVALAEMRALQPNRGVSPKRYVPKTYDDFAVRTFTSNYVALIAADIPQTSIAERPSVDRSALFRKKKSCRQWLLNVARQCHWIFQSLFLSKARVVVRDGYFTRSACFSIWWKSKGRVRFDLREYDWSAESLSPDWNLRENLSRALIGHRSDPVDVLFRLIPMHLPLCYLEGFFDLLSAADATFPKTTVRYFTCNANWHDEVFKARAASAGETGGSLWIGQHGGNYGVSQRLLFERFERRIADRFCTWGWEEGVGTIAMPAPKLMDIRSHVQSRSDGSILFTSTTVMQNGAIIDVYTNEQFQDYLAWQRRFVSALPLAVRSKLRIRLLRDWGRKFWEPLKQYPEIEIEDAYAATASFRDRLAACTIFVTDHLSTTYAEALASNTPTLMFWDPTVITLRPAARPFFQQFRECGVLHDSPESAAAELQRAIMDVCAWWSAPAKVAAVAAFKNHYLMTAPRPAQVWTERLLEGV